MAKKLTRAQQSTRYQNTLRAIKDKYNVDHRTAQRAYKAAQTRLSGKTLSSRDISNHPRIVGSAVRSGIKSVQSEQREKRERQVAKVSAKRVIEQALSELESRAPSIRDYTKKIPPEFDATNMVVKITIKGKDYTKKIHGFIVDRKGSKILQWKWTSEFQGKRHKGKRGKR